MRKTVDFSARLHRLGFSAALLALTGSVFLMSSVTAAPPSLQATPTPTPQSFLATFVRQAPGSPFLNAEEPIGEDVAVVSVSFDRGGYRIGDLWSAHATVANLGNLPFESFWGPTLTFTLSRIRPDTTFLAPAGIDVTVPLPDLDPGETFSVEVGPFTFLELPADPGLTDSLQPGVPDNGAVYLDVRIPVIRFTDINPGNERALAVAAYPTGPADPTYVYDPSLDADGDGWRWPAGPPPDGDCADSDPFIHPGAPEIPLNGLDDDCSGGDSAGTESTFGGDRYHADLDDDGLAPADGDCDDLHTTAHPGAPEIADGIDNDCDGAIDEGFSVPEFAVTGLSLQRVAGAPPYGAPTIAYRVDLENTAGPGESAAMAAGLLEIRDLAGNLFATGSPGVLSYSVFPDPAYARAMACSPVGLIAVLPAGAYGEVDGSNNLAFGYLPDLGPARVNFTARQPALHYTSRSNWSAYAYASLDAPCPAQNILDPSGEYTASTRISISRGGVPLFDATGEVRPDAGEAAHRQFSVEAGVVLHNGDEFLVETRLTVDPALADDPSDNYAASIVRFHNRLVGDDYFETVAEFTEPPDGSVTTGLSGTGPRPWIAVLAMAASALLIGAGAALGILAGRALALPRIGLSMAAAGGALVGIVLVGGVATLIPRPSSPATTTLPPVEAIPLEPTSVPIGLVAAQRAPSLVSCDEYLDPVSASPVSGAHVPIDHPVDVDLAPAPGVRLPDLALFSLEVMGPEGSTSSIAWPAPEGDPAPMADILSSLPELAQERGPFAWGVSHGTDASGTAFCVGSTYHTVFRTAPKASQMATPTPTAAPPTSGPKPPSIPTSTQSIPSPTPPPAPDTAGPSIKSVSDSPDPIKVSGKGCTPNTSTVSAAISDPSGVASASVLFFHTTIGQVPMSNSGGNTWTATLGPFDGTGDGTADYQIRAVDSLGNPTDSAFGQVTVLACIP